MALVNLLEPIGLVHAFQSHPPEGFRVLDFPAPAFATHFDLSTTLEPAARRVLSRLPIPKPMTAFIGTTVSEYALFPSDVSPQRLVQSIVEQFASQYSFVIVKDIPAEPALVGAEAFAHAQALADALCEAGFALLEGQALAYVPMDFDTIDTYFGRLSHTRRKSLRRKLRRGSAVEVDIVPTGDARFDDDRFVAAVYALYRQVYAQSEIHFDLLSEEFFGEVLRSAGVNGRMFVYRAAGAMIGWNLCFEQNGMLVDKYVGFDYALSREHDLYTVSWFRNLQYALERGHRAYVAGWTDPEIKRQLGARFTPTLHAVRVRNPLLRGALRLTRRWFESDRRWYTQSTPKDS